jgi:hypothetical protein
MKQDVAFTDHEAADVLGKTWPETPIARPGRRNSAVSNGGSVTSNENNGFAPRRREAEESA